MELVLPWLSTYERFKLEVQELDVEHTSGPFEPSHLSWVIFVNDSAMPNEYSVEEGVLRCKPSLAGI